MINDEAIRRISLFAKASEITRKAVLKLCQARSYGTGATILSYQDPCTDVFFVLQGRARAAIYSQEGKVLLFGHIEEGEAFGEIAAIDKAPRSATVEALEPTTVVSLKASDLEHFLRSDPEVAMAMLRHLTKLVRRLSERVFEFRAFSISYRIHAELLRLALESGVLHGPVLLKPAPTLAEIADKVSTHREAVSRELSRLGACGLVVREQGGLKITDFKKFQDFIR